MTNIFKFATRQNSTPFWATCSSKIWLLTRYIYTTFIHLQQHCISNASKLSLNFFIVCASFSITRDYYPNHGM